MSSSNQARFVLSKSWSVALVGASLALGCSPPAAPAHPDEPPSGIRVIGEGEVLVQPNVASVRLGVESRAATAPEAMQAANETMRAVTAAILAHGVAAADIQTSELSVHFERDHEREPPPPPPPPPQPLPRPTDPSAPKLETQPMVTPQPPPAGWFVVRNTLVLTLRQIDKLGAILGDAMQAGANNLHGLQMTLDDSAAASSEARRKAVEDARRKAEELAKAAGVRVGRVIEVVEAGAQPATRAESGYGYSFSKVSNVPVESGQIEVNAALQVHFAIEP